MGSFHVQMHCWDLQHVIGHHCHTNILGKDPDLEHFTHPTKPFPGFRLNRDQKYLPKYGMLWKVGILINLPFSTAGMAFIYLAIEWLSARKIHTVKIPERVVPAIKRDRALLLAACLVYVCTRESVLNGVFTLFLSWAVHSAFFFTFSQISHINEDCMDGTEEYRKKHGFAKLEWARHQLLSGYDYSCDSQVMAIASINLNQQICHHMFPSIHPCHYPALRKICIPIAAKYGIDYEARSSDTFLGAVTVMLVWLSKMNRV
jgi:linoleoyl-CoA desaturase